MIICLDNAESILDPRGTDAREIYAMVEELSQFSNICLCITSRISTIPPACETLDIPTLSVEAAHDTFYRIYKNGGRSDVVNGILEQLEFHALSITLLATVAHHNKWDTNRLNREWETQRTDMLHTQHDHSLATTIELSLASPMFQELGPDARGLLGVVAFFPQGVNQNNLEWLFPTLPNRTKIFDTFCILSLTYRSDGFVTMLAPLRDQLCPKDPASSPLLYATKDHYFRRLSVDVNPADSSFEDAQWITSEDVNVEHLLDVFTSIDASSVEVWDTCARFMRHLFWHKPRLIGLGPKIEGLPDGHSSKPECLFWLSKSFGSVGNHVVEKRHLVRVLTFWRERGDDLQVAGMLRFISSANRWLGLHEEGIEQVEEALAIYERLNDITGQAQSWRELASLLYEDKQLDAAEEAALRVLDLPSDKGIQFEACECHRILGNISRLRGETEKAINHFETALGIASSFNWATSLFWNNHSLAELFLCENRFDDAHAHLERARPYAINSPYLLGRTMELQAWIWNKERRLEEAKSWALRAASAFEKTGAAKDAERCRELLRYIEQEMEDPITSGELLETAPFLHLLTLHSQIRVRNDNVGAVPHIHSTYTP